MLPLWSVPFLRTPVLAARLPVTPSHRAIDPSGHQRDAAHENLYQDR